MREIFPRGEYGWACDSRDGLTGSIQAAAERIAKKYHDGEFDAIAFTGSSGCAIGFYAGVQHGIPLLYVRKGSERSHGRKVECNTRNPIKRYLIVDDFVSSGDTVKKIVASIKKYCIQYGVAEPTPVGILNYQSSWKSSVKINRNLTLQILD